MKKYFYSLLAATTLLFAASCSQDEELANSNGSEQTVTFMVDLPNSTQTRAIADGVNVGEGNMANKLIWALYETNKTNGDPLETGVGNYRGNGTFAATINMVKGLSYEVLFLAYNEENCAFDAAEGDDLKSLTLKSGLKANQEAYDAFVARHTHQVNAEAVTKVTLTRPFAQVNAATTLEDLQKAKKLQALPTNTNLVIKEVPTVYNVLTGEATVNSDMTYSAADILKTIDTSADFVNEVIKVEDKTYYYLTMAYVLAGSTADADKSMHNAKFEFFRDEEPTLVHTINIPNLPIQRNWRTNVIGDLLTQGENFEIVIDAEFIDDHNAWYGNIEAPEYDEATATYFVENPAQLAWVAAAVNGQERPDAQTRATGTETFAGKTIQLTADIDLTGYNWIPIGLLGETYKNSFQGTFDGNNKTISNLKVENSECAGLFGRMVKGTIKNLNVKDVNLKSNHYAGGIVAWVEQGGGPAIIENCHVDGGTIVVTPELIGDEYDNGDKAGGIAGFMYVGQIKNCSVKNLTISAYRDLGGIVGYTSSTVVTGNNVENVEIICDQTAYTPYADAPKDANAGEIIGRRGNDGNTESDNTHSNVNVTINQFGNLVLVGNAEELQTAVDAAIAVKNNGINIIRFKNDIEGDVTILQKEGVNLLINGADYKYSGKITVNGNGRASGNETLTFKAVNFYAADATENFTFIDAPSKIGGKYNYSHNVTIEDCSFVGNYPTAEVGSASFTGTYNLVMKNCTATNMHSALQVQSCDNTAIVENVTAVGCKNGISFGNTAYPTLKNSAIEAAEYGVRGDGDATRGNLVIENTTIDAKTPIVVRKVTTDGYAVALSNTSLVADEIYDVVFTRGSDDEAYVAPTNTYSITGAEGYNVFPVEDETQPLSAGNSDQFIAILEAGEDVVMKSDLKINPANMSNAYGKTGINVKNGQTIDGGGYTLDVKGAGGTWDSGINTTGGLIRNITVTGSFRGIFINHNSTHSEKVVLENVTIEGTTYTISCDQGMNQGLEATNSIFKGWTSYAATLGNAKFTGCCFGEGSGYAYCRPYAPTEFVNCEFEAGFQLDARAAVTFENCKLDGVPLTAENLATLVTSNLANATVK